MPRKRRFFLPDVPVHIVQRGHSRGAVFFEDSDFATYAHWLSESAKNYGVDVHAFVLMTNHVHLLATPKEAGSTSAFMQNIGRRYSPYSNRKYQRSGSVWEGRFKACLVQGPLYLLTVMAYIELNPVRAGMVELPGQYRWSSFHHNIGARTIDLVAEHPVYKGLAGSFDERTKEYAKLFQVALSDETIKHIRSCTQTGMPLANDRFKAEIEARLRVKLGEVGRGRPKRVLTP